MLEKNALTFLDFDFNNKVSAKVFKELADFHSKYSSYLKLDTDKFKDPINLLKSIHSEFQADIIEQNSYRLEDNTRYGDEFYFPSDTTIENFPSFFYSVNLLLDSIKDSKYKDKLVSKVVELINKNLSLAHNSLWALEGMNKGFYESIISDYRRIQDISKDRGYLIDTQILNSLMNELNSLSDKSVDIVDLKSTKPVEKSKDYKSDFVREVFSLPYTLNHYDVPKELLIYTKDFLGGGNYNNSTFDSEAVRADFLTYFAIPRRFKREEVDHKDVEFTLSETYQFLQSSKNLDIIESLTIVNLYMLIQNINNDPIFSESSLEDKSKMPFKFKSFPKLIKQLLPLFKEFSISYRGKNYNGNSALKVLEYADRKNEQIALVLSPTSFQKLQIPDETLVKSLSLLANCKK